VQNSAVRPGQDVVEQLANLRYGIRKFILYSQHIAAEAGLKPQEHQLLIAIQGADAQPIITSDYLAERMQMRRLSMDPYLRSLILKRHVEVWPEAGEKGIRLTESGQKVLAKLSELHSSYLRGHAESLIGLLRPFLSTTDGFKSSGSGNGLDAANYRLPEVKGI
jgi:DNA-binding MarR family transcriptional regulator